MAEGHMIHVGNYYTKEDSNYFTGNIIRLFEAAQTYRVSDETLRHALDCLVSVTEIKQVSISNCSFTNKPSNTCEE